MSCRVATLGVLLSSLVVACSALTDVSDLASTGPGGGAAGAIANGGSTSGNGGSGGLGKGGGAGAPKGGSAGAGTGGTIAGGSGGTTAGTGGTAGGGMAGTGASAGNAGAAAGTSGGSGGTGGSVSGAGGTGATSGTGGSAGTAGSGGGSVTPCEDDVAGDGIYVSPSGQQGATGTASTPVRTIAAGIELAGSQKKTTVYIEEGAYGESVVIGESFGKAIILDGGWRRISGKWTRLCGATASTTTIQSPNGRALEVNNSPGKVRVRHLTLTTYADVPEPGRTHYGVFAVGTPTKPVSLDLEDVVLAPGKGEDGAPAKDADPAAPRACDGRSDCANGTSGGPGKAAEAPSKGTFTSAGYVLPISATGGQGAPGGNGSKGGAATSYSACDVSCVISGGLCTPAKGSKSVPAGTCGCGGEGGKGGPAGKAGGGSIGLFVSGSAKVVVLASSIRTQVGGNGSPPGKSAKGASGTAGKATPETCCANICPSSAPGTACTSATPTAPNTCTDVRPAIPAGGDGGLGGEGGVGAHGLGGPSICVVAQGGGDAQIGESVDLDAAAGGTSGPLDAGDSRPFFNLP